MIRLQRIGKKGQAYFRVVLNEHTKKTKGEFHELLGTYNPHQKQFQANRERVEYWISRGAQVSPTVNNLMVNYKIWDRPKMQSWKPKPSSRAQAEGKSNPPAGRAGKAQAESKKSASPAVPAETLATPSEKPIEPAEAIEATPAQ